MHTPERLRAALAGLYEIEREIGHGGMATVYLANDVKHSRKVAIKVLRPELSAVIGAERFLAEIKTTANLQHPHILPLHDSGEADGTVFYVMPFVEGESLRDRLQREHQLPIDEAVRITKEIASALGYAHRHGVVHRDIKPENIMLHDGQAIVADFGIALAVSRSDGATRMTETGMSLGTPFYMAPEQAMGEREISPRADIYALACVLYEMLTGDPPFTGSTAQAIVARTITERPRGIVLQRHTVPEHVEAAVLTALEKLPADRFASAEELIAALDNRSTTRTTMKAKAAKSSAAWQMRAAIPALGVAAISLFALAFTMTRSVPLPPVSRFAVFVANQDADVFAATGLAVSPDGARIAFIGPADSGARQLWIKERDRDVPTPLSGTTGVGGSFTFSPDGRSIAFTHTSSQVKRIPITGGAPVTIADSSGQARGIAWLDNGRIVYGMNRSSAGALRSVPENGGTPVTEWESDTTSAWYPRALPGGRGVLFTHCQGGQGCPGGSDVRVLDLKSHTTSLVANAGLMGEYASIGQVIFVRPDGGMLAVPFSLSRLATKGAAVPIRDSVALGTNRLPLFALSREGSLYMRSGASLSSIASYELVWIDRVGTEATIDTGFSFRMVFFGGNAGWSLSPDGKRVAVGMNTTAGDNIWVKELPRGPLSRITFDSAQSFRPRWARDGKRIVFISRRNALPMLYRKAADGTGAEERLIRVGSPGIFEAALLPDERTALFRTGGAQNVVGGRDISILPVGTSDSVAKPLIASRQFDESAIAISPDGRWVAYESNETGPSEIYIRPYPNTDAGKWQVSTDGGRAPLWSRDGRELFYVNRARDMIAVRVTGTTAATFGDRQRLFHLRDEIFLSTQENYTPFDIGLDGRFLMARRVRTTAARTAPLTVTENWFTELRSKLGTK